MKEELTPWTPRLRIRAISDENMMGTREVGVRKVLAQQGCCCSHLVEVVVETPVKLRLNCTTIAPLLPVLATALPSHLTLTPSLTSTHPPVHVHLIVPSSSILSPRSRPAQLHSNQPSTLGEP